jgi:hypothetical protein
VIEDFEGGGSSIFSNLMNDGENYLYHYTSAATLAKIVESRNLRMGPYSKTNDPRETSYWSPTITTSIDGAFRSGDDDVSGLWALIGDVRDGVKLACFTLDSDIDQPDRRLPFHRGWARARMWHQYAENHSGACLIFDRSAWERGLSGVCAGESVTVYDDPVKYEDVDLAHFSSRLDFSSAELRAGGVRAAVTRIVEEHRGALFFTKNRDWEAEKEHRYLAISDTDHICVPVGESLVGIVLGQDFPETELSVLGDRLRRNGFTDVRCARLHWRDGAPVVSVFHDKAGGQRLALWPDQDLQMLLGASATYPDARGKQPSGA